MPRFDLYSAGAGSKNILNLKRNIGYDQLLSQYTEWKAVLDWVQYKREHPECTCKLFIDSGAYTAHTKGIEIDVDDYIRRINEIDDQVHVFAQVDKIPGKWGQPKTPEQLAEAPILSWENYLYMVSRVASPKKLLPIFHQGEDFKYLKQMLEYKYTDGPCKGEPIDYIGISCNKELSTNEWVDWFIKCFKMIRDSSNPNVKTHAFGMTSLKVLEQFPFTSADSTSWVRSAGFGNILVGYTSIYTSSRNVLDPGYVKNVSPALQESIDKIAKKYGLSLFEVIDEATTEERGRVLARIDEVVQKYDALFKAENFSYELSESDLKNKYIVQIKEIFINSAISAFYAASKESEDEDRVNKLKKLVSEFKAELDDINASGEIRCLFNICSLNEWAKNYEYRGTEEYKEELW